MTRWIREWLPRLVARVPATIHQKLLAAFLSIVVLLITVGAVGLEVLSGVKRHAEEVVTLQRKIAAYRQLQHDTTAQLYSVTSALLPLVTDRGRQHVDAAKSHLMAGIAADVMAP